MLAMIFTFQPQRSQENGARYLGEDRIGAIAPEKQADLVVIHGNPAAR